MSRSYLYAFFIGASVCALSLSCEQDNYDEPKLKPKNYSFSIPNKISFNFSQLSENRESVVPYINTLVLKNISNTSFSGEYAVFAFKDMSQNYGNTTFIKHGSFNEIDTGISSDSIVLETSDNLFADENIIASILSFNDGTSNHNLNGFYAGELNVLVPTVTDTTFQRSLNCTGLIDYQGKFNLFIENEDENDIVRLKGNFNSYNLISGSILDQSASNFSSIENSPQDTLELDGLNLKGYINYTNNMSVRLLQLNLTKQN